MARCGCGFAPGGKLVSACPRHRAQKAAKKAAATRKRNARVKKGE